MLAKIRNNIFLNYALSYSIILLIPVALIFWMIISQLGEKQAEAYRTSTRTLEQSVGHIENRFDELTNMVQILSANENLGNLLRGQGDNYYAAYRLVQDLQNTSYASSLIRGIYVQLDDKDVIIGSDGIITNTRQFYRMQYDLGEEHYGRWLEEMGGGTPREGRISLTEIRDNYGHTNAVLYVHPLISNASASIRQGRVLIYIHLDQLRSMVTGNAELERFTFSVASGGDEIPLFEREIPEGGERIRIERTSNTGKRYTGVFLQSALLNDWYGQWATSIAIIAAVSLIGGVFCIWLARRNSTPIKNMVALLRAGSGKEQADGMGAMDYLQMSMSQLLSDNELLQGELERRLPFLRLSFMERLFSGTLSGSADVEEQMRDLGIRLSGEYYCVVILRLISYGKAMEETPQRESAARMLLNAAIRRVVGDNHYVCSTEPAVNVLVLPLDERREQLAEKLSVQIVGEMAEKHAVELHAAIGLAYENPVDLFLSYTQARRVITAYYGSDLHGVTRYRREQGATVFYFPIELESKLIRNTVNGVADQVAAIFEELWQENVAGQRLSSTMHRQLIHELDSAYIKVLSALRESGAAPGLLEEKLLLRPEREDMNQDEFDRMRGLFLEVCRMVGRTQESNASKTRERIAQYMNEHFSDPSMSLAMISGEFAVTEVHMSRMFKEHMGVTYTQYMESARLSRAEELLRDSSMTVNEIAEACGYASSHAFRRAYKRYCGYLPSEQRKPRNN